MRVMLKGHWPGHFRRSVRDERGQVVRVLEFAPGEPQEVTDPDELAAIAPDLGHALMEVRTSEQGQLRVVTTPATDPAASAPTDEGADDADASTDVGTAAAGAAKRRRSRKAAQA